MLSMLKFSVSHCNKDWENSLVSLVPGIITNSCKINSYFSYCKYSIICAKIKNLFKPLWRVYYFATAGFLIFTHSLPSTVHIYLSSFLLTPNKMLRGGREE